MTRTGASVKNMGYAFVGQFIGTITVFFSRYFFLKILSSEYLGLNGLFTNILTVLSFTELGFGTAITYSLYKPLVENNINKIKSLMKILKKIYILVGFSIIILGFILTPFLSFLVNGIPNIPYFKSIYILYVINTAMTYFFSYKKTLVIADQNRYIATLYRYLFYVLVNIFQIIFLWITQNYIVYIIVQIVFTIFENIAITIKANKMYPYLKDTNIEPLSSNDKKLLFNNTKAMMMHKVGGTLVNSTDNIILSKFVGLTSVGLYSNYLIIKQALISITGQIFNAISAGVGNLCASNTESERKKYQVFENINFMGFTIYSFTSICLFNLITPFISLWLGDKYIFSLQITIVFVIIYYITGMRNPVLTFKEAMGLFYKDRYKSIIEAIVNLLFSIILSLKFGVLGVLLGTLISSVCISVWIEVYVLFKYGFKKKVIGYYINYFQYALFTLFTTYITYQLTLIVNFKSAFFNFIIDLFISCSITIILIIIVFGKKDEFKYFMQLIKNYLSKFKSRFIN